MAAADDGVPGGLQVEFNQGLSRQALAVISHADIGAATHCQPCWVGWCRKGEHKCAALLTGGPPFIAGLLPGALILLAAAAGALIMAA
jgi:hypothetical protein